MVANKLLHWITGSLFIPEKSLPPCSNGVPVSSSMASSPTTVVVPASMIPPATEPCRKLLPAALFLLTFFTVMTMLLIYMDTTAMRQQQFRLNMSREYELAGISQDDPVLIAYIKQWQLVSVAEPFPPHSRHHVHPVPPREESEPTPTEQIVARLLNHKRNGVFVEVGAYGSLNGGSSRTEWLEQSLSWRGLLMTPDARDYFRMRAQRNSAPSTLATHACLSTSAHPKEITYQETSSHEEVGVLAIGTSATEEFSSRVKCFPLYSLLLAAKAQQADFLSLSCSHCYIAALVSLPHHKTRISVIEIVDKDIKSVDSLLKSRGYSLVGKTADSTIYALRDLPYKI